MFGAIARPVPASALHVCDALLHQVTHPQALGNEAQHSPSQQRVANLVPSCPPPRYMRISAPLPLSSQHRSTSPESCPAPLPEHDDAPRRRPLLPACSAGGKTLEILALFRAEIGRASCRERV